MKIITSTQNPEIKYIDKLKEGRWRKKENKFLAEGLRTCGSLITAGAKIFQVYCTQNARDSALNLVRDQKLITLVTDEVMKKISPVTSPSGMVAIFQIPQAKPLNNLSEGIVLANISDPGNVGTLIRTAAALDVKSVVVIDGADIYSPKVIQSTAGSIITTNIFITSWDVLVKHKGNLELCALVVQGGKTAEQIDFKNKLLVVGNEAHGLPMQWQEQCEEKMTIPMPGKTESLNAAVAGSIAMYLAFAKN